MRPSPTPSVPAERGMALLLVLLLSLVLLPFSMEFAMQVQLETRTAMNVTDQLKIDNEIDGQYEVMLAYLRYDAQANKVDSYDDSWNDEELTSRTGEATKVALTTTVFDEQGKLNIRLLGEGAVERRALYKERLRRLLESFRRDTDFELSASEAEAWATAISEYVGGGAVRANIPTPSMIDKRKILVLDELDMLPEVRSRRFSFLLADQRDGDRVAPGLHRYLTIYGTGKINLNTTDIVVLQTFFPTTPELAERIVERRDNPPEEAESGTTVVDDEQEQKGNPYSDVMQINEVEGVDAQSLQKNGVDPGLDFDVKSQFFSFRVVGETESTRRDELFVVERVPGATDEDPLEGFRLLLRQERTDALEELEAEV